MNNILPEGWINTNLADITKEGKIGLVRSVHLQHSDKGVPYIRMQHYNLQGQWNFNDLSKVEVTSKELDAYALEEGDILFNTRNSYELVGKVAIWPSNVNGYVYNNNLMRMRFSGNILPQWIAFQMIAPEFRKSLELAKSATTSVCAIYGKDLFQQNILLAPLNEQRRIVSTIEQLTDRSHKARAALEDIPKVIAQFRQSVLAAAFRGDLTAEWREKNPNFKVDESFSHAHEDIKGWVTLKAEDVCNVQSGSTPKGKPFTEVGDIPYLKVYNIVDQRIDFNYRPQFIPIEVHRKELKRCVTLPGDVLMNIVGPPLGKIAIVTDQFQEWNINQALVLFRPNTGLSNKYLYYFLREGKFIREIDNETKGSVGQVNISLTQCRKCLIPIPSKEEQKEIVQRIELMFQQIDRIYQQYEPAKASLDTLDRSILARAFRGELVPQDPNDEPAAVLLERIRAEREQTSTPKQRGKTTRKNSSKQLSIEGIE